MKSRHLGLVPTGRRRADPGVDDVHLNRTSIGRQCNIAAGYGSGSYGLNLSPYTMPNHKGK
jgi:hypothetical protein